METNPWIQIFKRNGIEIVTILFVVLFMRLTIVDGGFFLGFKEKVGCGIPVHVIEYETKKNSLFGSMERGFGLMEVASEYEYVIVGWHEGKLILLDDLESAVMSEEEIAERLMMMVMVIAFVYSFLLALVSSKVSAKLGKPKSLWWFLIPVYNIYLLMVAANFSTKEKIFYFIGLIIPYTVLIAYGMLWGKISKQLGRNPWLYGITIPLFFFPSFVLAYGKSNVEFQNKHDTLSPELSDAVELERDLTNERVYEVIQDIRDKGVEFWRKVILFVKEKLVPWYKEKLIPWLSNSYRITKNTIYRILKNIGKKEDQ